MADTMAGSAALMPASSPCPTTYAGRFALPSVLRVAEEIVIESLGHRSGRIHRDACRGAAARARRRCFRAGQPQRLLRRFPEASTIGEARPEQPFPLH